MEDDKTKNIHNTGTDESFVEKTPKSTGNSKIVLNDNNKAIIQTSNKGNAQNPQTSVSLNFSNKNLLAISSHNLHKLNENIAPKREETNGN